jgi:RNA polymerase sigma factor (sigma-70 family)
MLNFAALKKTRPADCYTGKRRLHRMRSSNELNEEIRAAVRAYSPAILRLCFAYLKSRADAEDIAQEVFIAYMLKKPLFRAEAQKKSWLMRVAANKCKNQLKSGWRNRVETVAEELDGMTEEDKHLLEYVLSLDEKYRIPIHLHYYEGYSIAEIAKLTDTNPATVGTWLSRGRSLLKTMIGDDFCG